jgi:Fe-S-cluster containining protein
MIGVMAVRCLSFHAGYRCRHSGACCSGVFPIPAEPSLVALAAGWGQISNLQLIKDSRSDPESAAGGQISILQLIKRSRSDPEGRTQFLPTGADGACVFYERQGGLCAVHRLGGAEALPSACRHFPRVFLHDDRGVAMTLSHFCPTAAALLMDAGPLAIVDTELPPELDSNLEAFDAVGALPPLLRPDLLMDLEAFDAWERSAIATLGRDDRTCDQALDTVTAATEQIRRWKPGNVALAAIVEEAFASPSATGARDRCAEPTLGPFDGAVRRYLAAKLFANRIAYECRGLRTLVEWLRMCLATLRDEAARAAGGGASGGAVFIEAVRAADLALVHRTDTAALARGLARVEEDP